MAIKRLPSRPDLQQYKKQAKDLLKQVKNADRSAALRVRACHPRYVNENNDMHAFALSDARLVIAREYGSPNWDRVRAKNCFRQAAFAG